MNPQRFPQESAIGDVGDAIAKVVTEYAVTTLKISVTGKLLFACKATSNAGFTCAN
jgi:hypothetical protein